MAQIAGQFQMVSKVKYVHKKDDFVKKESAYLTARDHEGRLLDDELVLSLPNPPSHLANYNEWVLRKKSTSILLRQLRKHAVPNQILDIGCGNGWFIGGLKKTFPQSKLCGVDLNALELEQANRLFGNEQVKFFYLDILKKQYFKNESMDIVIFNASIQYFQDLHEIIQTASQLLKPKGSIWVNDSPFYRSKSDQLLAVQRSQMYYNDLGTPEMATYYHHHLESDLLQLGFRKIKNLNPFLKLPFSLYQFKKS